MKIRIMKEKDMLECLELLKQLTIVGDINSFDYISIYIKLSKNPDIYMYVAEKENKIVGMATLLIEQKFIHSGSRIGHIEDVVVDSEHRKMNIGKALIEKCLETTKERECYKVILDCDEKNTPFYSKIGFQQFGISMKINF